MKLINEKDLTYNELLRFGSYIDYKVMEIEDIDPKSPLKIGLQAVRMDLKLEIKKRKLEDLTMYRIMEITHDGGKVTFFEMWKTTIDEINHFEATHKIENVRYYTIDLTEDQDVENYN